MPEPCTRYAWRSFDEFGVHELHAVLRLRCEVFVVEQGCPYADVDGRDPEADHLLAWGGDGALAGCLRIFRPGCDGAPAGIGRVVTAPAARRTGLGRWLMRQALAEIERRHGPVAVEISAQVRLERFYAELGFVPASEPYDEDGIPHRRMRRQRAEPPGVGGRR